MQCFRQRVAMATVVAAALSSAPLLTHAQGLGGLLNKAKTKAAGSSGSASSAAGAVAGQTTGGDPGRPPDPFTVENQKQYARAAEADTRSWNENREQGTYWHRRLAQINGVQMHFTYDDAAVALMNGYPLLLWGACEDISNDLQVWADSNQAQYFLPSLKKVKEIHFTTTTADWAHNGDSSDPATQGYHLTWNASTGVLTAAVAARGVSSTVPDKSFSHWMQKNVK